GKILVSLDQLKIGSQQRDHQFHQLRVLDYFFGRSIYLDQLIDELIMREVISDGLVPWRLRRSATRDKQRPGLMVILATQSPSQFKGDQRAHAVPEKDKRLV